MTTKKVLITGSNGFIGKNLKFTLSKRQDIEVLCFARGDSDELLSSLINQADIIVHLAGVNRPKDNNEFQRGNVDLTQQICDLVKLQSRNIPVIYSSSIQAELNNPYGESKSHAEQCLLNTLDKDDEGKSLIAIYRLPGVFGKWSKPNYNSVVSTFCYNIAHSIDIQINDPQALIKLVYIDDVIKSIVDNIDNGINDLYPVIDTIYSITLGNLADKIRGYKQSRETLITDNVGTGFDRVLYATYISYFQPDNFSYPLTAHTDPRGSFVEILKTQSSGQFSYFTALPGVTRGGHFHHTKNEKFLVVKGRARFGFKRLGEDNIHYIYTDSDTSEIVETIPGWTHDITNIGDEEMFVLLWANEIFDRDAPDTYAEPINHEHQLPS